MSDLSWQIMQYNCHSPRQQLFFQKSTSSVAAVRAPAFEGSQPLYSEGRCARSTKQLRSAAKG